ncbi:hypothetical protein HU200_047174 [Digitaria exilis]|uniref:Uncharacterized protein n=1 Tax=Digitaria exilis TaxID=1010633 RepID=A0A835AVD3_9POAL|nr:hypothetical protein HU200_047174 [Digitaria exilis]
MCRSKEAVVASGARRPRPKHTATGAPDAAAPRRAAVTTTPRKQRGADEKKEDEEETAREGRRPRVSWAGADDDDDAGGGKASTAATVATVKIVLKRKDAEALVARLNAQAARERKARMAELKGELRTGECCGGGGGESPASCREAWRPQLAPIKENY